MNPTDPPVQRLIALDAHPDSFTAALVRGSTPAAALIDQVFDKVPLHQLERWARQQARPTDLFLLEASGNSFHLVRRLEQLGFRALVLESGRLGKLKHGHANNDRMSAVRIAKAYLSGDASRVWVPDQPTQQRRDLLHAHRKAVNDATRASNRLLSYLSDHGVRLEKKGLRPTPALGQQIENAHSWTPAELGMVRGYLQQWRAAVEMEAVWASAMAREVAQDPVLLSLTRLPGIRDKVAFALGAIIGDIHRFRSAKSLVNYVGLRPSFADSGQGEWSGGLIPSGRRDLRSLLVEAAHALARTRHPIARWGRQLAARKGKPQIVVVALARKLLVQVWHLLKGHFAPVTTIDPALSLKLGKIITNVGKEALLQLALDRRQLRAQMEQLLRTGRTYQLDPARTLRKDPGPAPAGTLA